MSPAFIVRRKAPDTTRRGPSQSPCRRGCCWTPVAGVCPKNRHCACHKEEEA